MRPRSLALAFLLAALLPAGVRAQTAAAQEKPKLATLAELARRSELWPPRVKLAKDFRLQGGASLRAGQEVAVHEVGASSVVIDTGEFLFEVGPADCDVLERARALVATLTPEELALTWDVLRTKSDLWPLRVALANAVGLADGTTLNAGKELALRGFEGNDISVWSSDAHTFFTIEPQGTDILARARARTKLPAAERDPFFVRALEASCAKTQGASEHPLANADLVVIYEGRLGCTRCAAFAPELKAFYAKAKAAHPNFELVFLSGDGDAESAKSYLAEVQLPGCAIEFDKRYEAAQAGTLPCKLLPGLFVLDRNGKLLEANEPNGGAPSAHDVLAKLEQRIVEAEAARAKK